MFCDFSIYFRFKTKMLQIKMRSDLKEQSMLFHLILLIFVWNESPSALTMCVYWIKDLGATLSLIEFCLLCVRSCCWTFYIPRKGNWNNLRTFKKAFFVDVKSFTLKNIFFIEINDNELSNWNVISVIADLNLFRAWKQ